MAGFLALIVLLGMSFGGGYLAGVNAPHFEAKEYPLAIVHQGSPFPKGYESNVSVGVVSRSELGVFLSGGSIVVRPLARIPEPCGHGDIDPSPYVWRECPVMLEVIGNTQHIRDLTLLNW